MQESVVILSLLNLKEVEGWFIQSEALRKEKNHPFTESRPPKVGFSSSTMA